ncbi:MAG TPA: class I SAM-dependent methyltransferase [Candidatus Methylomirabilis sp.]|nr:class I SAM-dependent methyltransferase [Candidatus Methylomirabilis sp.]
MFRAWNPDQPEITDLIVQHNPSTYERLPVRKRDVLDVFSRFGNKQALRAVGALPEKDGVLDDRKIDALLVRVHCEMQRLSEEFYHGQRAWQLLRCVIGAIRAAGVRGTLRIADVGCGTGYTTRWLAARIPLAEHDIGLTGMDLNSALIAEANRLAAAEELACEFLHRDAFSRDLTSHIFLTTGVIHHFRGEALTEFLRRHEQPETQAFLHFDFQPWFLAPFGSMFFHYLRMRTAVARHDGVLSAARAHSARTLTEAARAALPGFASGIYGARIWNTPAPRVFHTLVGVRPRLIPELRRQLGRRAIRLGELR